MANGFFCSSEKFNRIDRVIPIKNLGNGSERMFLGVKTTYWMPAVLASLCILLGGTAAIAGTGIAEPYQLGLQTSVTDVADDVIDFHNLLLLIITAISIFVLLLLIVVLVRFRESANPVPSKTSHNTLIEILWTVVPIFILIIIAIPSFQLLYKQYSFPKPDLTIKAIGHQWYWSYEYPDQGDFTFEANMLDDEDRAAMIKTGLAAPRLLATDNEVVVPVGKVVHVIVTASDVIHNWTIPAFGSKVDAVPGRTTATWFKVREKGVYYGQCSELCGVNHAFMPITVRVVDQAVFDAWSAAMKSENEDKAKDIIRRAVLADLGKNKVAIRE